MIIVQYITNSVFGSKTYIISIEDSNKYWLVDIGDVDEVLNRIPIDSFIEGVFITHTHYDHIYGVKRLLDTYPNCLLYTSLFGKKALSSGKLNLSYYNGDIIEIENKNIVVLKERDIVWLWNNTSLIVYETPGHDKSCLTYKIGNNLFTGDSFIPGIKVVDKFPNSDKENARCSQKWILSVSKGSNLYPGHGKIYENFQPEAYL